MKKNLKKIAMDARKMFESGLADKKELTELYLEYNKNVEDVDLFIKRAKDLFPELNCGLASVYLQKTLGGGEIINGKYKNKKHTFLLLGNKILDITADQYGGPKTYIGPLKKPWSLA
jgi:hypothetical protein